MSDSDRLSNQLSPQQQGREFAVSGQELWQWRIKAQQQAIAADIPPAEVDWFLQDLSELDRLELRLGSLQNQATVVLKLPLSELTSLWQQRTQARVPLQYLTGMAPWRQFSLKVSPAVLIPRPETESLIDLAVAAAQTQNSKLKTQNSYSPPLFNGHWADLGTGSGAIALGLATAFPQASIHAVDQSEAALAIARYNAAAYGLANRIHFYHGCWLQPLEHLKGKLSGIVSNPPYIPSELVPELQPEVAQHEPQLALDGGADGLTSIRHLVEAAPDYLHSGGIWLIEMMAGQASEVVQLLQAQGSYTQIQIHADLAGIDRFALAYRI